jgi:ElaB/YqjD/DUF883 family membrane-anchored ribosome-binding protein
MNPNSITTNSNQNKNPNSKTNDFTAKAKDYSSEASSSLRQSGVKAFEEVENMTADFLKQARTQLNEYAVRSLDLIKKNPVIAIAAAVTVGLVVAKMMRKKSDPSYASATRSTH